MVFLEIFQISDFPLRRLAVELLLFAVGQIPPLRRQSFHHFGSGSVRIVFNELGSSNLCGPDEVARRWAFGSILILAERLLGSVHLGLLHKLGMGSIRGRFLVFLHSLGIGFEFLLGRILIFLFVGFAKRFPRITQDLRGFDDRSLRILLLNGLSIVTNPHKVCTQRALGCI